MMFRKMKKTTKKFTSLLMKKMYYFLNIWLQTKQWALNVQTHLFPNTVSPTEKSRTVKKKYS